MLWNLVLSFLSHKIFTLRRNFKNSGVVNLSVLDRTINFFIFLSTCCPVAPLDLPHFTLESSQMPFKHIHYKLAGFFFSFNRKKKTLRFLMNPYCWYYNGVNWYSVATFVDIVLIKYVIHMFISWCGVVTSFCTWCGRFWLYYVFLFFFCYYVRWYIIK